MTLSPYSAYDNQIKTVESPGETDAAVLEKAAQILLAAKETEDDEAFYMALNYNQRIWTVIQTYMVEENPLPEQIRANLLSLSLFVDKQTYIALAEESRAKLDVLININRQIAAGFRSSPTVGEKTE
jgi:flagellar protein FlaF